MAGLGRRTFAAGEVLTASNVMGYLQDQAVMNFAGTAARGSAIGSAVSEGMVSYLADTNAVEVYNGTGWNQISQATSPNAVINGGFDIWQRGTSFTTTANVYLADRWYGEGGNTTVSQQTTGVPQSSVYCMRTAFTSTTYNNKNQFIESSNVAQFRGLTVTLQVKLRRNASFAGGLGLKLYKSATVDAGIGATWTSLGSITIANGSLPTGTTSSSWYTAILTVAVPNDGTANSLRVEVSQTSTEVSGAYWEMAEVQLEAGSTATPFRRNGNSIQGELAACQRYYYRSAPSNANFFTVGIGNSTTGALFSFPLGVPMRVIPTSIDWSALSIDNGYNAAYNITAVDFAIGIQGSQHVGIRAVVASGTSAGVPYWLRLQNVSNGYIGFNAEL